MFPHICTFKECRERFTSTTDYNIHRAQHYNEGKSYCSACKVFRQNIKKHYQSAQHEEKLGISLKIIF